jgi:antitoxin VapB
VRIPREFELDANVAIMHREDGRLTIEPLPQLGLLATLAGMTNLNLDFLDVENGLLPLDDPGL